MDNEKIEVYKSIELLNGVICIIKFATLGELSQAMFEFNKRQSDKEPYDVVFFMIKKICYFNGKRESEEYISNLSGESYCQISIFINNLLQTTL